MKTLIVLGGGVDKNGNMPPWIHARLDKAIAEWQTDNYSLLITTGKGRAEDRETEAATMKKFLIENGLPDEYIETEDESTSTIENAYFCRTEHIDPKGIFDLTIVTNQFHIERAASIFEFIFSHEYTINIAASADTGIALEDHKILQTADQEQAQFLADHIFSKFEPGNLEQIRSFIFDKDNEAAIEWAKYKATSDTYKKVTELMT